MKENQLHKIWRQFCYLTFKEIASGAKHGSARALVEKIRWKIKEAKGT